MSRELAGVIACFQEIEIACEKVQERNSDKHQSELTELRNRIKSFLTDVNFDKAEALAGHLAQLLEKASDSPSLHLILTEKVEVDAHNTSIFDLHAELCEVFEDLE